MGIFNTLIGRTSTLQGDKGTTASGLQAVSSAAELNLSNAATLAELKEVSARLRLAEAEVGKLSAALVPAAAHARHSAALDQLATGVMLTDTANCVVHANAALLNLLRQMEPEIRKDLPGFSADELVGKPADILHRNVAQQAHKPGHGTLVLGGHSFALITTPVTGNDGQSLGTVIEWRDLGDELALAGLIEAAVRKAGQGELDARIDCRGRHGPLAMVAAQINTLLDGFQVVVAETGAALAALAEGRLTRRIDKEFGGCYGQLKTDVNHTIDKLVQVVADIRTTADSVKTGAGEISSGNANLSQRTEEQAASLEETSAAMEQITTTVQQNAANAVQANTLARGARESAENGGDVVGKAVAAMEAISESSNKINDIIGVIDEIAFQTNLLALNAAVEAARAGDQGRGFAVVADEVRNLAGRSATAAKEIKELIKDSSEKVREGSRLVNKSGETLGEIVTAVKKVNDIVAEIATASDEQATGLEEINRAVGEMDTMTQQNAALVEEAAAASEALGSQSQALEALTTFFDLGAAFVPVSKAVPLPQVVARVPSRSVAASRSVAGSRSIAGSRNAAGSRSAAASRAVTGVAKPAVKAVAAHAAPVRPLPKPVLAKKPVYDNGDDKDWAEF